METILSITACNIRGIQSKPNRDLQIESLLNIKGDIICAQELRLNTNEDVKDVQKRWTRGEAIISIGEDRADGIGILFSTDVTIIKSRGIVTVKCDTIYQSFSDHLAVRSTIKIPGQKKENYWKFNTQCLGNKDLMNELKGKLVG